MAYDFGTVVADPVVLQDAAEKAHACIRDYRDGVAAITKLVSASSSYWQGEAAEAFRQVYQTELAKAERALESFEEYPKDLLAYAGIYSEVIDETQRQADSVTSFEMPY